MKRSGETHFLPTTTSLNKSNQLKTGTDVARRRHVCDFCGRSPDLGLPLARYTGMKQTEFDEMLHAEEMPVCTECTILLKEWAESDPRLGRDHSAWLAFVSHRYSCRESAGLVPDFYAHPIDIPGEQQRPTSGNLFLVTEESSIRARRRQETLKAA